MALEEIRSVYWRLARGPQAPAGLRRDLGPFAEAESRRAADALLSCLPCLVVNPPAAVAAHRQKPAQSAQARALGWSVPPTLVSNEPDAVRRFAAAHPEGVVVKPVGGGAYARRLGPGDLHRDRSIAACPMQYQGYVAGEDLRVYVVGDEVLPGRIVRADPGPVDFRRDAGHRAEAVALHEADRARCRALAAALGQRLSGVDLRRTPAGELVFLEANPSPMFLRFQADTGHPILERLVDLLLRGGPDPGA